jgi:hypothetical protein
MKYIHADKLIAEIERRLKRYDPDYTSAGSELKELLSFVASIKQEQPDNEDIDKVAQELYEHLYELKRRNNVPTNLYDKQEIIDLWKAGIEYAYNHPRQEQPEVDLDDNFIFDEIMSVYDSNNCLPPRDEESLEMLEIVARHFYELGLNARKEE